MSTRWDAATRALLEQARRNAGGGAALANALRDAGVGPEAGAYSESAVSNWIKGRTRPPADVVLAAATLYHLSLDTALDQAPSERDALMGEAVPTHLVAEFRLALTRLEALVRSSDASRTQHPMTTDHYQDLTAVYATRSDAHAAFPVVRTLATANAVTAMGASLNAVAQEISDVTLAELIENGLTLQCLFLDPLGDGTKGRELEEGLAPGELAQLTQTNIAALTRLRSRLSPEARPRLTLRTYDMALRYNITLLDDTRTLVQLYLPQARGLDSPTLLIDANDDAPRGLFPIFANLVTDTWSQAHALDH